MTNYKMKDFFKHLRDEEYANGSGKVARALELILEHVDTDSAEEMAGKLHTAYYEDYSNLLNENSRRSMKLLTALANLERDKGSDTIADKLEEIKHFITPEAIALEIFKCYNNRG